MRNDYYDTDKYDGNGNVSLDTIVIFDLQEILSSKVDLVPHTLWEKEPYLRT